MLDSFRADLHIHTCLSPCASLDMTPKRIIEEAVNRGLNIVAITDHNAHENIPPAVKLGEKQGVFVVPGMEVTTSEEVHVLGLFPSIDSLKEFQEVVYNGLPEREGVVPDFEQVIVNENDEVEGFNRKNLIGATTLGIKSAVSMIRQLGGIAIASHIDREVFGIIAHIGFIPEDVLFDALEISWSMPTDTARESYKQYAGIPWVRSSDAHHIQDIGRCYTEFIIKTPSFDEIKSALKSEGGRAIRGII